MKLRCVTEFVLNDSVITTKSPVRVGNNYGFKIGLIKGNTNLYYVLEVVQS